MADQSDMAFLSGLAQPQSPAPSLSPYAAPQPMNSGYQTKLDALNEMAFQQWVKQNNVPFDPSPTADYDMRGFWQAQRNGDPAAQTSVNANDGMMHFTDTYKTPYHESFSRESKYALPNAPRWNGSDQLVDQRGKVMFDERKKALIQKLFGN